MENSIEDYVPLSSVVKKLGSSYSTLKPYLNEAIKQCDISVFKLGSNYRIRVEDFIKFIQKEEARKLCQKEHQKDCIKGENTGGLLIQTKVNSAIEALKKRIS